MPERFAFRIHGTDCADEVAILRRELRSLVGESSRLSFDILRGKMIVDQGEPAVTEAGIVPAVARTGMRAEPCQDTKPDAADSTFWQRRGRTVKAVFVVLTFGGYSSLWPAIAADMGVSLVVIGNALRLLRSR